MTSRGTDPPLHCRSCGTGLRRTARFCDHCGVGVTPSPPAGERKQVTVLFADVVGSMRLAAAVDPERLQGIMHDFFNRAAAVVQRYGGTVDKFTGDGLMALFGAPVALEDHALRACIASLGIQDCAQALSAELCRREGVALQIRVGLNSGEVVVGDVGSGPGRYTAVGHSVGMAQRMESAAPPTGVLCSLTTARLVENDAELSEVESVVVKGFDAPVPARRLLAVDSDRMVLGRNENRLLGRDTELHILDDLIDARCGTLVTVVGEPGIGKSRLLAEVSAHTATRGNRTVLARCDSHTSGVAFRALSAMLRALFGVQGLQPCDARARTAAQLDPRTNAADASVLYDAMGVADPGAPDPGMSVDGRRSRLVAMMVDAVRRRGDRVLFVLEDAHWIDTPSDEVLAEFAAELGAVGALMIVSHRPEYAGALAGAADHRLRLGGLSRDEAVMLAGQVIGEHPSVARLTELVADAAAGNPFFAEEIVRDLAGRDVLQGSRGRYRLVAPLDSLSVPPTVQAVLAARIDRLPAATKSLLNAAAVIGLRFDLETLQALVPTANTDRLGELVAAELIDQTEFVPSQRYCFHHPLGRKVAYDSQLSASRASAHRTLAHALAQRDSTGESAALIATHLESAGELLEAHRWHMRAAEWLRPRDLAAARDQWDSARRVADLLPADVPQRTGLQIAPRAMICSTSLYLRDDLPVESIYAELQDLTGQSDDATPLAVGMAGRIFSLCVNEIRVPDALDLADDLAAIIPTLRCEPGTRGILGNALAFARFAGGDFEAALAVSEGLLALPDLPVTERAPALALHGFVALCLGDARQGRRDLFEGTRMAQSLHPVNYAAVQLYSAVMAALGILDARSLLADKRAALRRAEAFGDICGIVIAQWSYGTVLSRVRGGRPSAPASLSEARANAQRSGIGGCAMTTIAPDLAVASARAGHRDDAIADLRISLDLYSRNFPALAVFSAEALVELLIERRSADDLTAAAAVLDSWESRWGAIPGLTVWVPRGRALLSAALGDRAGFRAASDEYLRRSVHLGACGRLAEARRLATDASARTG